MLLRQSVFHTYYNTLHTYIPQILQKRILNGGVFYSNCMSLLLSPLRSCFRIHGEMNVFFSFSVQLNVFFYLFPLTSCYQTFPLHITRAYRINGSKMECNLCVYLCIRLSHYRFYLCCYHCFSFQSPDCVFISVSSMSIVYSFP